MMKIPRGLSEEEAAAWSKLAASVTPLEGRMLPASHKPATHGEILTNPAHVKQSPKATVLTPKPAKLPNAGKAHHHAPPSDHGLDGHWERKLRSGQIAPDFTLDLHGHTLDSAHRRLDSGLAQARAMGARVVLLIAGKPRPVDPADRGTRRGAIRAKILDWLAVGPHGSSVAAIRKAHRRHGGEGALYLVLRRPR